MEETLVNCSEALDKSNDQIYHSLYEKTENPTTSSKAKVWYPKATLIKTYADKLIIYIDSLKNNFRKEADLILNSEKRKIGGNNHIAISRIFKKQGNGALLYEKLKKYKQDLLLVDSLMSHKFNNEIVLTTKTFDSLEDGHKDFTTTFFGNVPSSAALAMLSQFQNNIRIIENQMLYFCYGNITFDVPHYNKITAIIGQSSSYVRAGEEIQITAGVGTFSMATQPEIIISGKKVSIEDGVAIYKFKASGKSGKYIVPAIINYTDSEGKRQSLSMSVEYTVAKEK